MTGLVRPPTPHGAAELRLRVVREPTSPGDDPLIEVVDRTDWSGRPTFAPRLRVTYTLVAGPLSTDVVRSHLQAKRRAFAECLVRGGRLYEQPPFRGVMEWSSRYTHAVRPGPGLPRTVERCLYSVLGRTIDLPFTQDFAPMVRAEMLFEAASRTSIVVLGPD
ncbi:MAG: hypothetical protein JRH11_16705 [Deltaproteobacteria bacterium]|nr:hypothetical protein [Deltaproteobacteria bacterium]